jgi:cell division protein FtsL
VPLGLGLAVFPYNLNHSINYLICLSSNLHMFLLKFEFLFAVVVFNVGYHERRLVFLYATFSL